MSDTYAPGSWVAVVASRGALLADLPPGDSRITAAWHLLRGGVGADSVLEALVGSGLSHLPPFALVTFEDEGARVVVRRRAQVEIDATLIEATAGTWDDTVIPAPIGTVRLLADGPGGDVHLPLCEGVARASILSLSWEESRARVERAPAEEAPAELAPVVDPAAEETVTEETVAEDDELAIHTMSRAELVAQVSEPSIVGPSVLAVRCPAGHLTPPFAPGCRVCGLTVDPSNPTRIARPALGTLTREGGDPITLDRDVVLGRAPQPVEPGSSPQPNLVRIADPGISRSHAHVVLDGWQVFARDLGSSNGSEIEHPDGTRETMVAEQDYLLEHRGQIILAGDVVFRFEVGA